MKYLTLTLTLTLTALLTLSIGACDKYGDAVDALELLELDAMDNYVEFDGPANVDVQVNLGISDLEALADDEFLTADLRDPKRSYVIEFDDSAQLDRVQVIEGDERYFLGESLIEEIDAGITTTSSGSCVCVAVCCWHWRCYCSGSGSEQEN